MVIVISLMIILVLGWIWFYNKNQSISIVDGVLTATVAKQYVTAWAKEVNVSINTLKNDGEGGFYGGLGSLGFEYTAKANILIVRGYVFAYDDKFNSTPDLLPWLNAIADKDPDSVDYGHFESLKAPWEQDRETSLFLRKDITDANLSESGFVSSMIKFRGTVVEWDRNNLTEALDSLVKKRRGLAK